MLKRLLSIPLFVVLLACGSFPPGGNPDPTPTPTPTVTPTPTPAPVPRMTVEQARVMIDAAYLKLLNRLPDPFGIGFYTDCLRLSCVFEGKVLELTEATMHDHIRASAEYKALHPCGEQPCPAPPVPQLRAVGRTFVDQDGKLYVPRWESALNLLSKPPAERDAVLDRIARKGYNGLRVFAGDLSAWAPQTADSARAALPGLLDAAAARGLTVEVTAITGSGLYDTREHLRLTVEIVAGRRGVVLELANEIHNPSQQDPNLNEDTLRRWGRELVEPRGVVYALGATDTDEPCPPFQRPGRPGEPERVDISRAEYEALPASQRFERPEICAPYDPDVYPAYGGTYSTAHLDRGRDLWNQFRRVREIFAIADTSRRPALNNEPLGCAEPGTPGQRYYDPAMAYVLGALDRAFVTGGVHHSEAGRYTQGYGPVQEACADNYVAGQRDVESAAPGMVGQYKNVGHDGGPVGAGSCVTNAVRCYSFIAGNAGVVLVIGVQGAVDIAWANGWRQAAIVAERTAQDGRRIVVIRATR